jgi:5-methylcytosine-specific restriction endonuclease McrA
MTQDVGTTPRKPLTPRQRLAMFEAHKGICCICETKIQAGTAWIDEHVIPLALGGTNDPENRAPAHAACAAVKTKADLSNIAKAKRVKQRHIGIKKPRTLTKWRRFDGSVVHASRER